MKECVVVTTYKRPELLSCCIQRIRAIEPDIRILIFPDHASAADLECITVREDFFFGNTRVYFVPEHDYHGNSYNTMEALRAAFNEGWDRVYYIEEDVMVHKDFFSWHREIHEECPDIFASMAWIFNRYAPITDDVLFQPWYYAIGTCFTRHKLGLIIRHATPRYYEDMQGYIERNFKNSKLNSPFGIQHYEQDGLIQRVLDLHRGQTVSPGIAKCSHLGMYGYNRGWNSGSLFFEGCKNFSERIQRLEEFIADPYARAEVFGREIVEREIGHELPKREYHYRVTLPGGWESEFTTEVKPKHLRRINSVPLPPEAEIVLL